MNFPKRKFIALCDPNRPRDAVWENILALAKPNTDQHRQGHTNPKFNPSCWIESISSHIKCITIIFQWARVLYNFWMWCVYLVKWRILYVTPIPGISAEAGIHVMWMTSVCRLRTLMKAWLSCRQVWGWTQVCCTHHVTF